MDVASVQRNMKTGYFHGSGVSYDESLRRLAYTTNFSVPAIGQKSVVDQMPILQKSHGLKESHLFLHPTEYIKLRHTDHLCFSKSNADLGSGTLANTKLNVFDRLYVGSKSNARPTRRNPSGSFEVAADVAFKNSDATDAVPLYTKAIGQAPPGVPNLFAYEKRCVCNAELGRYTEALADAEFILQKCEPRDQMSAMMRVRAIKDFLKRTKNFDAGYHQVRRRGLPGDPPQPPCSGPVPALTPARSRCLFRHRRRRRSFACCGRASTARLSPRCPPRMAGRPLSAASVAA